MKLIKYFSYALMLVTMALLFWAVGSTPSEPTVDTATAVGGNLYWGYVLLGLAIATALFSAVWDMIQKPESIKGSIFTVVLGVVVVVVAYVVAQGHTYEIIDLNTMGYFDRQPTVISDASIMVTYVAGVAAAIAAIYSAVTDALK